MEKNFYAVLDTWFTSDLTLNPYLNDAEMKVLSSYLNDLAVLLPKTTFHEGSHSWRKEHGRDGEMVEYTYHYILVLRSSSLDGLHHQIVISKHYLALVGIQCSLVELDRLQPEG